MELLELTKEIKEIFKITDISQLESKLQIVMNNKSVKKTLTIPYWLNKIAEKEGINFSVLLQDAIKNKLNIKTISQ